LRASLSTAVDPADGTVVRGRDEIRAVSAGIFALEPRASIEVMGKVQGEGLALAQARWSIDGVDPDGNPVELAGRGTIVSRRQPDGRWLIVLENPVSPA
jgi:ketosteroid isomerase-like protein